MEENAFASEMLSDAFRQSAFRAEYIAESFILGQPGGHVICYRTFGVFFVLKSMLRENSVPVKDISQFLARDFVRIARTGLGKYIRHENVTNIIGTDNRAVYWSLAVRIG